MGDVDISLRSIASTMPEDLSGALFPGARVEVRGCRESQLTQIERRVDELLELLVDGVLVLLHVGWQLAWARDVLERAYTYQTMTVLTQLQRIAVQREAAALRAAGEHDVPAPDDTITPVESAVVLLSGRRESWELELPSRTSRAGASFSGVQVRVVAVCWRPCHSWRNHGARSKRSRRCS